jgi:hypothetical protein
MPEFQYYTVQAGADTFSSSKISQVLEQYIHDSDGVLNPCAGETALPLGTEIRNDIDESVPADHHVDARDIGEKIQQQVDVVTLDPPFSEHQAVHTYGLDPEQWPGYEPVHREVDPLLREDGYLIQAGFSAVPLASSIRSDYTRRAIVVCNQLGRQDDWILTVDQKTPSESSQERPWTDSDSVIPNSSQTEGGEFAIDYTAVSGAVTAANIWDRARPRTSGETLLLDWQGDIPASQFGMSEPVERFVSQDQLVRHISLRDGDTPTRPANLDSALSKHDPDTVVVWPYEQASNHSTEFEGSEIGFIRAIKQQLDRHIDTGTKVLLIGNTATGMRQQWDYEHTGVSLVDGENCNSAWYISEFWKTQRGLGEPGSEQMLTPVGVIEDMLASPVDNLYSSDGSGNWVCETPRVCLERHPALYYHCPTCGAAGGNLCIENGEPLPAGRSRIQTHTSRQAYAETTIATNNAVRVYDGGNYLGTVTDSGGVDAVSTPSRTTLPTSPQSGTDENTQESAADSTTQQSLQKFSP